MTLSILKKAVVTATQVFCMRSQGSLSRWFAVLPAQASLLQNPVVQKALVTAIRALTQQSHSQLGASQEPLPEAPSSRVAFLETFPCLNPFTAAGLGARQCSLQELLHRPVDELRKLVPDVPARSLNLFLCQAAWGKPVRGLQASGRSSYNFVNLQEPSQQSFQSFEFPDEPRFQYIWTPIS